MKNPVRRPTRCMSMDAGIVVSAMATIAIEIGAVAHAGDGAMRALAIPPMSTTTVSPDAAKIWAAASVMTLFIDA